MQAMEALLILLVAFVVGAIPFTLLVARRVTGEDLRQVGTGTVSGTSLYHVAGFVPLAVGGVLDILKGMPGPLLAGGNRPVLAAFSAGFAVAGHNWSPYLKGAGGRGLSPAMGALLVIAWPGTVLLLAALALGRIARQTGLVTFIALLILPFFLLATSGGDAALAGFLVTIPVLVKRVAGNEPPPTEERGRVVTHRLLFDNDG